jgi:drug/metabolite transporter (DMT)-like permease
LIYALSPAGVFLWCVAWLKTERWLWGKTVGLTIAFCGVGVVLAASFQPHVLYSGKPLWLGNLLTACALVCWSWYLAASRPLMRRFNPLMLTSLLMILGMTPYLVVGIRLPFLLDWTTISTKAWFGLSYLVLVNSVAGYFLTMFAVTRISSSQTALYMNLQPIVAMAFSAWYGGEEIPVQVFVGGFLVVAGIFVMNWVSLTR